MPSGSRPSGGGHFSNNSSSSNSNPNQNLTPNPRRIRQSNRRISSYRFREVRPRRVRAPRVYSVAGRSYRLTPKRQSSFSLLAMLVFFMVILSIVGGVIMNNANKDISVIKSDFEKYHSMIEYAENNPEYLVEGKVTGIYTDEGFTKYYYTYEFETATGAKVEGYTFYLYTLENLKSLNIAKNSPVTLAVDTSPITLSTDSIPLDFKNFNLEDDEEYTKAQSSSKTGKMMLSICASVGGVGLIVAIIVFFTSKKSEKEQPQTVTDTASNSSNPSINLSQNSKSNVCNYCGARLGSNDTNCKNCGAPRQML